MTDRVIIPLGPLGTLALDRETFDAALAAGAEAMASTLPSPAGSVATEPLLDSEQLAVALSLPVTWIEQAAREHRIPSYQAGRWRRFDRAAVVRKLAANGKQA